MSNRSTLTLCPQCCRLRSPGGPCPYCRRRRQREKRLFVIGMTIFCVVMFSILSLLLLSSFPVEVLR